jgi:hypothetical protein
MGAPGVARMLGAVLPCGAMSSQVMSSLAGDEFCGVNNVPPRLPSRHN